MNEHVYKHHNKTLLLYHLVFPAKYRREVFNESVSQTLKEVCIGISMRYELHFKDECDENRDDNQKHNGTRNICKA